MIKNAKLSGYYFYINLNIWGNFQICISVPLSIFISTEFCMISMQFDVIYGKNMPN